MSEWDDKQADEAETGRMSEEAIAARMRELQVQMDEVRRKEEILLEILARRDPELAAEMRKQMKR